MADVTLVQGDTGPFIRGELKITRTQAALDLTNATAVRFQMRQDNDRRYTVDEEAEIIGDPEDGVVRYEWADGDLNVAGEYICQWEITWSDDTIQTTNPANTVTIRRQ